MALEKWYLGAFVLMSIASAAVGVSPDSAAKPGCDHALVHSAPPYIFRRTLRQYWEELGNEFPRHLGRLPPGAVWLDSGAGLGLATAQMHETEDPLFARGKAFTRVPLRTIAVSREHFSHLSDFSTSVRDAISRGAHRIIEGQPVESLSIADFGPCDLITDVFGPASYTDDLSSLFNHYYRLLAPGGHALIRLSRNTQIETPHGQFELLSWVRYQWKLPNFEVSDERLLILSRPSSGAPPHFPRLEKVPAAADAPVTYPPSRLFRETSSPGF